jgi:tetratricopeptide (TPR) repeat protein|tara:strand:+ start:1072 stop:1752 length:681 start_codon:yes stop_codon:yes gene_type:complete
MAKKSNKTDDQFAQVENALSKTEQYIEDNQNKLMKIVAAVVAVIALFIAYQNLYLEPQALEAQSEMFNAEIYFEKDSFNLALNGDGQYLGFIDIADQYSSTKQGKLANYYAGLSYLYLKDYDNAIDYLNDFKSDDIVLSSLALGSIGDAYLELDDKNKALSYYKKAANNDENSFTTPRYLMKQALILEYNNEYDGALEIYLNIQENFNESRESQNIDKYIYRAKNR